MISKISACLVAYNEEKLISRCLNSLKGVIDDVVIVHDGPCLDRTIEICHQFGARVFIREHMGFAEAHWPFAFQQASGDWILRIDADEFLSVDLKNNIRSLVNNGKISAYEFVWPLWNGQKTITVNWPYKRVLFRKNNFSFLGLPHFISETEGLVKRVNLILDHQPGYNKYKWKDFGNSSWVSWSKIQAKCYLSDFTSISKFNYSGIDWPTKIKIRKNIPLLVLPFDFVLVFLKTFFSGAFRQGLIGFKVSLMHAVYRALVDYYIFKYHNK